MTKEDLHERVRSAFQARTAVVPDPEPPDWTTADGRGRSSRFAPLMAAVAVLGVLAGGALISVAVGSDQTRPASPGPAPVSASPVASCAAEVPSRVLPQWARTGFTDAEPRMPYVLGDQGDIAAIIFGYPLAAPPLPDRSNKILWVSRVPLDPGDPLRIEARLDGSGTAVERTVLGGPGPSGIDLPRSGCWHLTLRWSGHTDTMALRYSPQN
ncbi:hypothetical protein GCM10023194_12370 [Planotetraspora phitsanulokensis]|uniref:Uncharacterized protein n=1 Tax=Planotetraspora phitsanulokensis TaxID=575192 RepID=A0A8J3XHN8_9ACTN|nr:hypothetical protein [Planotetraspora phitsanulokensis]GII41330.1 hypothetical protein Pph01_63330 [Planotetraspora phitsanulokensis]